MAIEILAPQLANQIAAGEVVERPASVIKELVENSLDAGANRIDIEIEKGGAKLIRIRDNGKGIPQVELALALSRHATSKVHTLADLESIVSFGFRGEALASISSVSRLTLTSRIESQTEAWSAYAEGSEMAVKVVPAAHPVGTSIEVFDLFFNTPARRRFLKSDKTEFSHIDEWLKRIALARTDVHFTLSHNGKQVRNYRRVRQAEALDDRLTQVCGKAFSDNAVKVDCQHDGIQLVGYLQGLASSVTNDVHYFYVNGRLVRDRLVNHAVRQAFAASGFDNQEQPSFVLMLTLDPRQVDVNVHPAKHEVRFHQARYVHDFILQALQSALSQVADLSALANIDNELNDENFNDQYSTSKVGSEYQTIPKAVTSAIAETRTNKDSYYPSNSGYRATQRNIHGQNNKSVTVASESYQKLLQTPDLVSPSNQFNPMPPLLNDRYWVLANDAQLSLLAIEKVAFVCLKQKLLVALKSQLVSQPLLMPVSVVAEMQWQNDIDNHADLLEKLGIELRIYQGRLIIKKVPPYLRQCQLAVVIPEFLNWIAKTTPNDDSVANWIAKQAQYVYAAAPQLWREFSQLPEVEQKNVLNLARTLPWQTWINEQICDPTISA